MCRTCRSCSNTWTLTGKVDVNLSDRHRLFGFFAGGNYATNFTGSLAQTGAAGVLPEPYTQGRIVQEAVKLGQIHDTFSHLPDAGESTQPVVQPDCDSPAESDGGGRLSAEGGLERTAAERRATDVPGHQLLRDQFSGRLAGDQRALLHRSRSTRSRARTTCYG